MKTRFILHVNIHIFFKVKETWLKIVFFFTKSWIPPKRHCPWSKSRYNVSWLSFRLTARTTTRNVPDVRSACREKMCFINYKTTEWACLVTSAWLGLKPQSQSQSSIHSVQASFIISEICLVPRPFQGAPCTKRNRKGTIRPFKGR